jgi:hypothetical protein
MTKSEKQLLTLFSSMDTKGQEALISYAEFLAQRHPAKPVAGTPLDIVRPEQESVVAAIKRLSHTYPMLDKQMLLHETSSFMMQHLMQGRASVEVIDDMEIYFSEQYQHYCQRRQDA